MCKSDNWCREEKMGCNGCFYDELIEQAIKQKYKDEELIILQEIIKKQKRENEKLKNENVELKMITKEYNSIKQDLSLSMKKIVIIADIDYFDNGIFKEKFIHESKLREEIRKIKYDIIKTKDKIKEENTFPKYINRSRKIRLDAFITKSNEIKERLEKILYERN